MKAPPLQMALRTAGRGGSAVGRGGAGGGGVRGMSGASSVERGRGGARGGGGGRLGGRGGGELGGDRGGDRFYTRSTSYDETDGPSGAFPSSREKGWDPDGPFLPVSIE